MNYLKFILVIMLVAFPVLVYLLWPGDEEQILKLVNETIAAAEAGDAKGVMEHISLNYHDEHGLSYLILRKMIEKEIERLKGMKVELLKQRVRIIGEKAYVTLEMRVSALRPDGSRWYRLGSGEEPFYADLELKDEKPRGWKVYSAKYGGTHAGTTEQPGQRRLVASSFDWGAPGAVR